GESCRPIPRRRSGENLSRPRWAVRIGGPIVAPEQTKTPPFGRAEDNHLQLSYRTQFYTVECPLSSLLPQNLHKSFNRLPAPFENSAPVQPWVAVLSVPRHNFIYAPTRAIPKQDHPAIVRWQLLVCQVQVDLFEECLIDLHTGPPIRLYTPGGPRLVRQFAMQIDLWPLRE